MAKQITIYMTTISRLSRYYAFWSKKPEIVRTHYTDYGYRISGQFIMRVCKHYVNTIIPQAKLSKRGIKKLTIRIEDIE